MNQTVFTTCILVNCLISIGGEVLPANEVLSKETVTDLSILIVVWNHERTIGKVLTSLIESLRGISHKILLWDNCSNDNSLLEIERVSEVTVYRSDKNLGYCEAVNRLIALAPVSRYYLTLNPDALPLNGAIQQMIQVCDRDEVVAAATPKLLRACESLETPSNRVLDAAGMFFTSSFRHLDRGSGEIDHGQYDTPSYVPGGTGAALLLKGVLLPELALSKLEDRLEMLDERFFAYREDAELALRIVRLGYRTRYVPDANFLHVRRVTPERRSKLPTSLNTMSVRNRFLLQDSHFLPEAPLTSVVATSARNLLVRLAARTIERDSLTGLEEASNLIMRSSALKDSLNARQKISNQEFWDRISRAEIIRETA